MTSILKNHTMETLKEKKVGNYNVEVKYDMDAESPRQWDELSVIYSNHRAINPDNHSIQEIIDNGIEGKVGLAVWLFEHSGYSFKTTELGASNPFGDGTYARFDSGIMGIIAMPIETAQKEWGEDWEKKAKDYMTSQIDAFDKYANGEVYCYVVENNKGGVEDSCGDFYNIDECFEEGISSAKSINQTDANVIKAICCTQSVGVMKNKFYEIASNPPTWVDELLELIDEDKAVEWLTKKLEEFVKNGTETEMAEVSGEGEE